MAMGIVLFEGSVLFALLFLSSAVPKFRRTEEHVEVMRQYRLLPATWVKPMAYADAWGQLLLSLCLLVGFGEAWVVPVAGLMLLVYTIAIMVNLLRDNREISCGCGGVVGNHSLSWGLVVRNIVLMCLLAFGWSPICQQLQPLQTFWNGNGYHNMTIVQIIILYLVAAILTLFWAFSTEFVGIRARMKELLKNA